MTTWVVLPTDQHSIEPCLRCSAHLALILLRGNTVFKILLLVVIYGRFVYLNVIKTRSFVKFIIVIVQSQCSMAGWRRHKAASTAM